MLKLIAMPPGRIAGGQILWQGRDIVPLPADEMNRIRAREIAIVFQEPMTSLNPVYTIGDQIGEVIALHEGLSRKPCWSGPSTCWRWSRSRTRSAASTIIRISSRAACGSA